MFLILLALVDASLTDNPWVPVAELALKSEYTEKTAEKKMQQLVAGGRAICEPAKGCRLATRADITAKED